MSEPKQDQTEETNNTGGDVFEPMGAAMESVKGSLSVMMQNLAQSLQGNMAAINLLGEKLEDMIRSNIIIKSHLKPIKDAVQLTIRIENKTNFPLVHVEGNLTFDSEQEIIVEYTDSYFIVIDEQDNQEVEEVVPSLFMNNPTYLQPNSKYEQVSLIKTHEPISTVGYIYLSFPHPIRGEGEEIEVEEEYGLYLIDQLMKSITSEQHDEPKNTIQRTYNVKFLRTMMDIHPIKGIDKGMCITLSGKNFEAICKVVDFSGDYATCQVEFLMINGPPEILDRVVHELDVLSKIE